MAVKLRLRRMGRKKQPFYRIVAIDSRSRRDGKYIEKVGHYNPLPEQFDLVIDKEKAMKWLNQGAELSDTVKNLFSHQGIMMEWDMQQRGLDEEQIAQEMKKREAFLEQERKRQEARDAMLKRQGAKETEPEESTEQTEPEQASEPVAEEKADESEKQA
ncbi:30S ribosomal protein S16 [candidate division KSB1 bacterium]|nr:30S ribosomal protein S16 [candidate division KSB1 bacterium]